MILYSRTRLYETQDEEDRNAHTAMHIYQKGVSLPPLIPTINPLPLYALLSPITLFLHVRGKNENKETCVYRNQESGVLSLSLLPL